MIFLATACSTTMVSGESAVPVAVFQEAADAMLGGKYGKAEALFDRYIGNHPDEPAGPLMKAAVIHYHAIDYEDYSRSGEYFRLLDTAEKLARSKLETCNLKPETNNLKPETCNLKPETNNDVWGWYFLYSARTLKAVWSITGGDFFRGIIDAKAAMGGFKTIESSGTGNGCTFDVRLTLGSFRFWKSEATRSFLWLPFVDDQREQGIAEVKEGLAKGTLVSPLSSTVLIEMLMVYDAPRAVALAGDLAERYPSCRLFRWQLGESLKREGRYDEAVRVLTGIAEEMANDPDDDGSGPLRCWWKLAVLADSLGKDGDCRRYCEEIMSLGREKPVGERQKKRIEGAQKLLEKLNDE